jgi:hypothetical protein
LAAGSVRAADHNDLTDDDFTERWTAVASETYRAAVAQRARPVEQQQQQSRLVEQQRPRPVEETSAAQPAPVPQQFPMAQATEDDLKQYRDERRAKAEKNAEPKKRDDVCRKGRVYFYRARHQYWHCRR